MGDDESAVTATLDLIRAEITGRIDRQTEATDRIDTKVTVLVGFTGTAIPLVAARPLDSAMAAFAIAAAAISVLSGVWCIRPRRFIDVPEPGPFLGKYQAASYLEVVAAVVAARADAFTKNEVQRKAKVLWWRVSIVSLVVAAAFATAAMVIGAK